MCESGGGKPIPRVAWFNGTRIIPGTQANNYSYRPVLKHYFLPGKASSFEDEDGTGTGRNEIRLKLGRGDLGSQFTCQAENEAIEDGKALSATLQIDVNRECAKKEAEMLKKPRWMENIGNP